MGGTTLRLGFLEGFEVAWPEFDFELEAAEGRLVEEVEEDDALDDDASFAFV